MAYKLRYVDGLVPIEEPEALTFGALIHGALEKWYTDGDRAEVIRFLGQNTESVSHHYLLSCAMMTGYMDRYADEEFVPVKMEVTFNDGLPWVDELEMTMTYDEIQELHSFSVAGKVDGIVLMRDTGDTYLIEHKTARTIDAAYIENLGMDFQTTLYALYLRRAGHDIKGVIYNIIAKCQLRQGAGETEAEFKTRRAALIAKSKTGKSSAKRKKPETDYDFSERLNEWYKRPEAFHRETLYINTRRYEALERELWILAQALEQCVKDDLWYANQSQCLNFGRCQFLPICSSDCNPNIIANLFKKKEPHSELKKEEEGF